MEIARPLVWIVLVNWNGWRDTLACVRSCASLTHEPRHLVVVDNGSTDASVSELRAAEPGLDIIDTGADLGFGAGCNAGIAAAIAQGADYVWLLNNDTEVEPQTLSALVEAMEADPSVGIAASKIYYHAQPETLWYAGGYVSKTTGVARHVGKGEIDRGQHDAPGEVGYACGCSLLARSSVIHKVGPMDESYFLYWEETDWCERMRRAGWGVSYVPASRVWHKVGASMSSDKGATKWRYIARNRLRYFRKLSPGDVPRIALFTAASAVYLGLTIGPRTGWATLRGLRDAFAGRSGLIDDRV